MNFIGESRTGDALVPSMVKDTLGRVFPNVEVYTSPAYFSDVPRAVNMIFVAYDGARTVNGGSCRKISIRIIWKTSKAYTRERYLSADLDSRSPTTITR